MYYEDRVCKNLIDDGLWLIDILANIFTHWKYAKPVDKALISVTSLVKSIYMKYTIHS